MDALSAITRLMVAVRIRPISEKEASKEGVYEILKAQDDSTIIVTDPNEDLLDDILRKDRNRDKSYTFDHVFDQTCTQEDIFEKTVKTLIDSVLNGFNATIFAYGATGAGKTYTMMGAETTPGIMVLILTDLFARITRPDDKGEYDVTMSYLEIYNENIRDLLSGKPDYLELRDDAYKGAVVAGITYVKARSPEEVLAHLKEGNKNRTQEATGANDVSSRSHAVLQVFVTYRTDMNGDKVQRFAKLSMIDLAGSERAAETNNRGIRMLEGANINRSLLALGNCINALVDPTRKNKYVNYRDSKLTRLLKDSLGGNCRTVMIANVSPASNHFEETVNTLKYAGRARTIETRITQQISTYKDDAYKATIAQLQHELEKPSVTESEPNLFVPVHKKTRSIQSLTFKKGEEPSGVEEIRSILEKLFSEQRSIRTKLLETDEKYSENTLEISKKSLEYNRIQKKFDAADKDEKKRILRMEDKLLADIKLLEQQKSEIQGVKVACDKKLQELDEKIKNAQQNIPRHLDKRTRQYINMLVKAHYLEMDNLDLDLNYTLSGIALRQKDKDLQNMARVLEMYESLTTAQKQLLVEKNVTFGEKLKHMYKQIQDSMRNSEEETHHQHVLASLNERIGARPDRKSNLDKTKLEVKYEKTLAKSKSRLSLDDRPKSKYEEPLEEPLEKSRLEDSKLERQKSRVDDSKLERQKSRVDESKLLERQKSKSRVDESKLERQKSRVEEEGKLERQKSRVDDVKLERQKSRIEDSRLERQKSRVEEGKLERQKSRLEEAPPAKLDRQKSKSESIEKQEEQDETILDRILRSREKSIQPRKPRVKNPFKFVDKKTLNKTYSSQPHSLSTKAESVSSIMRNSVKKKK